MTSSQAEQATDELAAGTRLPYEKPVLRSISLVAEQVLSVGCKTFPNVTGANQTSLACLNNTCRTTLGS